MKIDEEIYKEAKELVLREQKVSAEFLQEKLCIGYAHSARILDMLEEDGIISGIDETKTREVIKTYHIIK